MYENCTERFFLSAGTCSVYIPEKSVTVPATIRF